MIFGTLQFFYRLFPLAELLRISSLSFSLGYQNKISSIHLIDKIDA